MDTPSKAQKEPNSCYFMHGLAFFFSPSEITLFEPLIFHDL